MWSMEPRLIVFPDIKWNYVARGVLFFMFHKHGDKLQAVTIVFLERA